MRSPRHNTCAHLLRNVRQNPGQRMHQLLHLRLYLRESTRGEFVSSFGQLSLVVAFICRSKHGRQFGRCFFSLLLRFSLVAFVGFGHLVSLGRGMRGCELYGRWWLYLRKLKSKVLIIYLPTPGLVGKNNKLLQFRASHIHYCIEQFQRW
jgi:hypothetical protein